LRYNFRENKWILLERNYSVNNLLNYYSNFQKNVWSLTKTFQYNFWNKILFQALLKLNMGRYLIQIKIRFFSSKNKEKEQNTEA
jgi:hypothetical protein